MNALATSTLVPLEQIDPARVLDVLDRAFGPSRLGLTSYLVRGDAEPLAPLCLAALDEAGELVGVIKAHPVALELTHGARLPLIMVGPVAVVPEAQGAGYGKALMIAQAAAIEDAVAQGAPELAQVLIGDAPYYGKFGFAEAPRGWTCPGPWDPARLLVRTADRSALPPEGALGPWRG